jgi:hypothetical protein
LASEITERVKKHRAERIARNFFEIAEMQGRASGPKIDGIET